MRAFDAKLVRRTMKARAISQTRLARTLGFASQSAVSALLAGKRRVTVDEAAAIYALLGLANADQPDSAPPEHASAQLRDAIASEAGPDYGLVPVIALADAGHWREAVAATSSRMPVPSRLARRGTFGIAVAGDSIDLLVESGGLIVVDSGQKELAPGSFYLIADERGEAIVRRYCRDPARFETSSRNPAHAPFLVGDQDFAVLGKIVWKSAPVI